MKPIYEISNSGIILNSSTEYDKKRRKSFILNELDSKLGNYIRKNNNKKLIPIFKDFEKEVKIAYEKSKKYIAKYFIYEVKEDG